MLPERLPPATLDYGEPGVVRIQPYACPPDLHRFFLFARLCQKPPKFVVAPHVLLIEFGDLAKMLDGKVIFAVCSSADSHTGQGSSFDSTLSCVPHFRHDGFDIQRLPTRFCQLPNGTYG